MNETPVEITLASKPRKPVYKPGKPVYIYTVREREITLASKPPKARKREKGAQFTTRPQTQNLKIFIKLAYLVFVDKDTD